MGNIQDVYVICHLADEMSATLAFRCEKSAETVGMYPRLHVGRSEDLCPRSHFEMLTGWKICPLAMPGWYREFLATDAHLQLWQRAVDQQRTIAILEHDVIVKKNFVGFPVADKEILFLGPRVDAAADYEVPARSYCVYPTNHFEGAHAYALTPATAARSLARLRKIGFLPNPIDALLGVCNVLQNQLVVLDPPAVVCEVPETSTTIEGGVPARYNFSPTPGFLEGLTPAGKLKYKFDRELMRF